MATLHVRNVPEEMMEKLKDRAARERRSVSAEILSLVEDALESDERRRRNQMLLDNIRENRRQMVPAGPGEDAVSLVREDRSR
jgi:antitoxin FitA